LSFVEFDSFYKEEHPCSTVFLSANKYIRKMKGGSQSILVQCDDNRFYVVKMAGNPQGPNVVSNPYLRELDICWLSPRVKVTPKLP
jgi:hypothetical protein